MIFTTVEAMEKRFPFAGAEARFFHTENVTLAYWDLAEGAEIPGHSHPHEQVTNVIEGEVEFSVDGDTAVLGPGHIAVIGPGSSHSAIARSRCKVIDVFYPVREDYK